MRLGNNINNKIALIVQLNLTDFIKIINFKYMKLKAVYTWPRYCFSLNNKRIFTTLKNIKKGLG